VVLILPSSEQPGWAARHNTPLDLFRRLVEGPWTLTQHFLFLIFGTRIKPRVWGWAPLLIIRIRRPTSHASCGLIIIIRIRKPTMDVPSFLRGLRKRMIRNACAIRGSFKVAVFTSAPSIVRKPTSGSSSRSRFRRVYERWGVVHLYSTVTV
jgi:hypothetical protein